LFSPDIFRTRGEGFFRCGRPHFLAQKNFGFFEIYGVSALRTDKGGRGVEQVRTFADKGERGSIFTDFVRTSFMDGPKLYC